MFEYFVYLSFPIMIFMFFQTGSYRIAYHAVQDRYKRFKNFHSLVASTPRGQNQSKTIVIIVSAKMLIQAFYLTFLQYMNNSVCKLDRNVYEVSYVINGRMYKMLVTPQRGPAPVLQISNDEDEDVTEQVLPYLGPQYDWHNNRIAPEFFGCKTLTFELADGSEYTYDKDNKALTVKAN